MTAVELEPRVQSAPLHALVTERSSAAKDIEVVQLHAAAGSCINAGDNRSVSGTNDLDNAARIKGWTVDIGAYEFGGATGGGANPSAPNSLQLG